MKTNAISFDGNNSSSKTANKKPNNTNKPFILAGTAAIGAISGGRYALKNPSESTIKKISELKPNIQEYYTAFLKCFNLNKAAELLKSNNIKKETHENVTNVVNSINNLLIKEEELQLLTNTPIKERVKSFKTALSEANQSHFAFWQSFNKLGNLKELNDIGILNYENYQKLLQAAKQKGKEFSKIITKPILKGAGLGAGIGILIGLGINSLIKSKKD